MKLRRVVVALGGVVMLACAPRVPYTIKTGDQAYERGEYAAALEHYKRAKASRVDQKLADERIARTEKKIAELELAATESLFTAGKFEEGMEQFMAAQAVVGAEHPATKHFITVQEPRQHATARAGLGEAASQRPGRHALPACALTRAFASTATTETSYVCGSVAMSMTKRYFTSPLSMRS